MESGEVGICALRSYRTSAGDEFGRSHIRTIDSEVSRRPNEDITHWWSCLFSASDRNVRCRLSCTRSGPHPFCVELACLQATYSRGIHDDMSTPYGELHNSKSMYLNKVCNVIVLGEVMCKLRLYSKLRPHFH